jgi:hypothetical protein
MLGWLLTKMTEDQREFCIKLSIELIDNTYNRRGRGREGVATWHINGYSSKVGHSECRNSKTLC